MDLILFLFQIIFGVMVTEICLCFMILLIIDDVSLFPRAKMLDWVENKKAVFRPHLVSDVGIGSPEIWVI